MVQGNGARVWPMERVTPRGEPRRTIGYIQKANDQGMYRAFRVNGTTRIGRYHNSREAAMEAVRKAYGL